MTYEAFLAAFEDSMHAEWMEGEAIAYRTPDIAHQRLRGFLSSLLTAYTQHLDLGEVLMAPGEMLLVPGHISRAPDIMFIARAHLDRLTEDRLVGPADLVIELLADSSVARDRGVKFAEYQEAGIPEYWIFDSRPGQEGADFYRLGDDGKYLAIPLDADGRYHSAILPGFWFHPRWCRQNPLPQALKVLRQIAPQIIEDLVRRARQ